MKVYLITAGCVHEGGSVYGTYVTEELAREHFDRMITEKRERARQMHDWTLSNPYGWPEPEDDEERQNRAKGWLEETTEIFDNKETYIFSGIDYITLTVVEAR